jgi:protein-export membrane protein SecD
MLFFSRWKVIAILATGLAGAAFAASHVSAESFMAELDGQDLLDTMIARQAGDVRTALREAGIDDKGVKAAPTGLTAEISEAGAVEKAREILDGLVRTSRDTSGNQIFTLAQSGPQFIFALPDTVGEALISRAVEQSMKILHDRLDRLGVADAFVQRHDRRRILIKLPDNINAVQIARMIGRKGMLTFQAVCVSQPVGAADIPPADCVAYPFKQNPQQKLWVQTVANAIVSGDDINDGEANIDPVSKEPVVNFRFNRKGTERFGKLTSEHVGKPLAIILDQRVVSAPRINEPILGGAGQISGYFTPEEAWSVALVLRSGALPARIHYISTGPGTDAEAKQQDP